MATGKSDILGDFNYFIDTRTGRKFWTDKVEIDPFDNDKVIKVFDYLINKWIENFAVITNTQIPFLARISKNWDIWNGKKELIKE